MEGTPLLPQHHSSPYPSFNSTSKQRAPSPPPSYYDVSQVSFRNKENEYIQEGYQHKTGRQPGGIASVPFVAMIALIVAFILIFGFALITPPEVRHLQLDVLQQSDPSSSSSQGHLDIDTAQGKIRGFTRKSRQGRNYTAFYKVPYAEPPLNSLRFKDPIAPKSPSWSGLRAIPVVAPQCIQKAKYSPIEEAVGEEDCLYANLYIPLISSTPTTNLQDFISLPVMVYIHGGGFADGNGSRYGADYFMDEDVILITFQFRLGPFGFLNTEDDVIQGNMGFKDQVQMLKWVKDNVKYYGGDPNKVTIFGNSGGGISVGFLMVSPMARDLFHRAITQSGGNVCASRLVNPRPTVEEVGRVLNCSTGNSREFLDCLVTKDAKDIALVRSSPTMYFLTRDPIFMPDTPYNLLKSNPNPVPYIVGNVNYEMVPEGLGLVRNEELAKGLNDDFGGMGNSVLGINLTAEELLNVKEFYFGEKEIGNETFREAITMVSDRGHMHCSYTSARMHSRFSPTYMYYLSKPPAKSYTEKDVPDFKTKELGMVSHADELQYFFLYYGYPEIENGDPEYFQFSAYLVKLWATFAQTGIPSLNNVEWKTVDTSSNSTFLLELNDNPGQTDVMRDRMNLWDQFTHKQLNYE